MRRVKRWKISLLARNGLLLIGFCGVVALLTAMFEVRDRDLAAARDEVLREKSCSSENTPSLMPKITRRDFEFKLPVPGEKGKYDWKVSGLRSVSEDATTDRIFGFAGEMLDRGDVIRLSSPVAFFDKEKRVLSSRDGVILQSDWARIEAREMVAEMKEDHTRFSDGVTMVMDTDEAAKREAAATAPPQGGESNPAKTTPDEPKEKKRKRSPLVITSQELHLYAKKNLVIFIGNVVAKDEGGTIVADRMEAYNYSQEEKEKNPELEGVKTVICKGNVKIDQVEGKKQALCARAVYDGKANTVHLYSDPETGKKVIYRDEEQKWQAEALEMTLDRNKDEVKFTGEVKTVDFNPDRKSFLGFIETGPAKTDEAEPGQRSEEKSTPTPK